MPDGQSELLGWWTSLRAPVADRRDLRTALLLVFWCIWRHRNDVVFNAAIPSARAIMCKIAEDYASWKHARLFRGDAFGFPEPVTRWQMVGD